MNQPTNHDWLIRVYDSNLLDHRTRSQHGPRYGVKSLKYIGVTHRDRTSCIGWASNALITGAPSSKHSLTSAGMSHRAGFNTSARDTRLEDFCAWQRRSRWLSDDWGQPRGCGREKGNLAMAYLTYIDGLESGNGSGSRNRSSIHPVIWARRAGLFLDLHTGCST